jgi:hypothetical protein
MTCDHVLGATYEVEVAKDAQDTCSACHVAGCQHRVGERLTVTARPIIVEADMHEISIVPRPRDPRCQIESVELDPAMFMRRFKRMPSADAEIWLHACIYPCSPSAEEGRIGFNGSRES